MWRARPRQSGATFQDSRCVRCCGRRKSPCLHATLSEGTPAQQPLRVLVGFPPSENKRVFVPASSDHLPPAVSPGQMRFHGVRLGHHIQGDFTPIQAFTLFRAFNEARTFRWEGSQIRCHVTCIVPPPQIILFLQAFCTSRDFKPLCFLPFFFACTVVSNKLLLNLP